MSLYFFLLAYAHDSAQDVIYAPLDGERVITKGIYYVNGKSKKDDQREYFYFYNIHHMLTILLIPVYESMLQGGTESIDGIDPFFVTRPPQRTTVAVKYNVADSIPLQSSEVNEIEEKVGESGFYLDGSCEVNVTFIQFPV